MSAADKAEKNFLAGYNCSQSVVLAFEDKVALDSTSLLRLASPFGGGISRMRETCGAVSGMAIVIGLIYGYDTPETGAVKAELYQRMQTVAREFEEKAGSLVCRDLLGLEEKHDVPLPSERTADFYAKRPCGKIIRLAAEILENYIENEVKHE